MKMLIKFIRFKLRHIYANGGWDWECELAYNISMKELKRRGFK